MKPLPWDKSPQFAKRFYSLNTRAITAWVNEENDGADWCVWCGNDTAGITTETAPTFDEALAAAEAAFRKLAAETIARHEREVAELKAVLG